MELIPVCFDSLLAKLTCKDRHGNGIAHFQVRTSTPPNQITAQSTWNELAEQERQFDGGGSDDLT